MSIFTIQRDGLNLVLRKRENPFGEKYDLQLLCMDLQLIVNQS